jgi:hypothetical protein
MRRTMLLLAGLVGVVGAVAVRAPGGERRGATVDGLVARLRATGQDGTELADAAIVAVAEAIRQHSAWHLWQTPEQSLAHGHGWSHQYNTVLYLVLKALGFRVHLVRAARVRGFDRPWFMSSHTWVKVQVDGRWRDACAASTANRVGRVGFVPLTDELPMYRRTRWAEALALMPFVIFTVWKSWLTGVPVPSWVFEEGGQ